MALNRIQAGRLLNAREMSLFESSLSDRLPELSSRELGSRIRQLREQRDKAQAREDTGKAQALDEALHRLERRQTQVDAAQSRGGHAGPGEGARPANALRPERPAADAETGGRFTAAGPPLNQARSATRRPQDTAGDKPSAGAGTGKQRPRKNAGGRSGR